MALVLWVGCRAAPCEGAACDTSPICGDGVVDAGEACDDGGTWGGDGCDAACAIESGMPEQEPNDAWKTATPADDAPTVDGALPEGDVDCWSFDVGACAAVSARQVGDCAGVLLSLHDPQGARLAVGAPDVDGCSVLEPADQPGARWVEAGRWSVCAAGVNGAEVRGYSLAIEVGSADGLAPPGGGQDLDGDATPDGCDADRDGDGVPDADDNCPTVSNGPDTPPLSLSPAGFVTHWLAAGPFSAGPNDGSCRPSETEFVGESRPLTVVAGDTAGDRRWQNAFTPELFDLLATFGSIDAPREAYALVYLHSDTRQPGNLAVGADDGVVAWLNGAKVLDIGDCQGVTVDQFQADFALAAGWNTLLIKVRDNGGGWGLMARFVDDFGNPILAIEPSLWPGESYVPTQADGDRDGLGDVCDPTP